jgi:hypothetical protein
MQFSHTRLFPQLSGSALSPSNVFVSKVSGTQSDATYYHPEQDIIETHNHYSSCAHLILTAHRWCEIRLWKTSPDVYRLEAHLFR